MILSFSKYFYFSKYLQVMQVLIPETCLLLTPKGFCFPSEIKYGTEILIVNSEKKLASHTIIDELEEPKSYLTKTLLSQSLTSTLIPAYKIHTQEGLVDINSVKVGDLMPSLNRNIIKDYETIHDELSEKNSKTSPISSIVSKYLAQCELNQNRQQVVFTLPDEQSAREKGRELQKELQKELGGDMSYRAGKQNYHTYWKNSKTPSHKIFFDNTEFYQLRESFDLKSDKINSEIYSNGFFIFFSFLHSLLTGGYQKHLQFFERGGKTDNSLLLLLPLNGKIRKLIQNTALIWNKYTLSFYSSEQHRNVDELKLEPTDIYQTTQKILEIKQSNLDCYKLEIPFGSELIVDYIHVKPFELTDSEMEHLQLSQSKSDQVNFADIRRQITSNYKSISPNEWRVDRKGYMKKGSISPLRTITEIQVTNKSGIHTVGQFDKKSDVNYSKTKYGYTNSVTGLLSDDTGQIKVKLWGDFVVELEDGEIIEIVNGYVKNGIFYNKRDGKVIKH